MIDFLDTNIDSLKQKLVEKEFSVSDVLGEYMKRIDKLEPSLNALISHDVDLAQKQAEESQKMYDQAIPRKLEGVPIVIKDMLNYKGTKTTAGSKMLADYKSVYSATVVDRLVGAGAIIVGKANMDEFAMGSSGENSAFGVTRNPWDIERVPGGSSSGSAVSVASGYCLGALGSDTGGSIRQPASLTGVVGLKPTYGRVSRYGAIALGSSLDQVGPLARSVADVARIYEVIAGYDQNDAMTEDIEVKVSGLEKKEQLKFRVGLVKELYEQADESLKQVLMNSIEELKKLGCVVELVSWTDLEKSIPVYYIIQSSEASANLARYDGIRYGFSMDKELVDDDLVALNRQNGFGDEVKRRIMLGTYSLSSGFYDDYFQKAARVRTMLIAKARELFNQYDLLIGLTSPVCAFKIGEKIDDPLQMYLADIMTVGISLAGLPALSLPAGLVNGLPVGVQIVGKWFEEDKILGVADRLESVLNLDLTPTIFR